MRTRPKIEDLHLWRELNRIQIYTLSPQKTCDCIFYNNFNNKCPITIIFGIVSRKHRKMVSFPTSPCGLNVRSVSSNIRHRC